MCQVGHGARAPELERMDGCPQRLIDEWVEVLIQGYNVMREKQELKAKAKRKLDLEAKNMFQVRS